MRTHCLPVWHEHDALCPSQPQRDHARRFKIIHLLHVPCVSSYLYLVSLFRTDKSDDNDDDVHDDDDARAAGPPELVLLHTAPDWADPSRALSPLLGRTSRLAPEPDSAALL